MTYDKPITYSDLRDEDERLIWNLNHVGRDGDHMAGYAVALHRKGQGRARGRRSYAPASPYAMSRRPTPVNIAELWRICQAEAERRIGPEDVSRPSKLASTRLNWAVLALGKAVGNKHAGEAAGRTGNFVNIAHQQYFRLQGEAEAFGATLEPEWLDEDEKPRAA